jgi:hypothetical protein
VRGCRNEVDVVNDCLGCIMKGSSLCSPYAFTGCMVVDPEMSRGAGLRLRLRHSP